MVEFRTEKVTDTICRWPIRISMDRTGDKAYRMDAIRHSPWKDSFEEGDYM